MVKFLQVLLGIALFIGGFYIPQDLSTGFVKWWVAMVVIGVVLFFFGLASKSTNVRR
jgi:Ca2+/H+ antiporter